jgi:hypothetical protein
MHPPVAHSDPAAASAPWFRHPIVWFTLALPAAAIVGSVLSAVLAVRHADPVVDHLPPPVVHDAAPAGRPGALEPAETARNHAVTPRR